MNPNHLTRLLAATFSVVFLSASGYTAQEPVADGGAAVVKDPAPAAVAPAKAPPTASAASWADLAEIAFDQRPAFFAGLAKLEARVAAQFAELAAKRAAMKSTTDAKGWDFAMKEMDSARAYLKSTGEELSKATVESWEQQKEAVGRAWVRTQAAYANVKASTTT